MYHIRHILLSLSLILFYVLRSLSYTHTHTCTHTQRSPPPLSLSLFLSHSVFPVSVNLLSIRATPGILSSLNASEPRLCPTLSPSVYLAIRTNRVSFCVRVLLFSLFLSLRLSSPHPSAPHYTSRFTRSCPPNPPVQKQAHTTIRHTENCPSREYPDVP